MTAATVPAYMRNLLDRAAMLLHSQFGLTQLVTFDRYSDGDHSTYFARAVWLDGDQAPRVVVFDARTGDFVCRSIVGNWFEIDCEQWQLDVAEDATARDASLRAAPTARRNP